MSKVVPAAPEHTGGASLTELQGRSPSFLGARGLRQLGGVWPKAGQYMSIHGHLEPNEPSVLFLVGWVLGGSWQLLELFLSHKCPFAIVWLIHRGVPQCLPIQQPTGKYINILYTSSTAQGGGGTFKDRKL